MMKYLFRFFIFALIIIGMNACKSKKKATAVDLLEETVRTSCYDIESFYVPSGRLDLSFGGQSISLNGNIYIRPDSIFYFRGRLLIDVVRGAIYNDSFVVINLLERTCYTGKNEYLERIVGFPVNPESLLMLFTDDKCDANQATKSRRQQFSVAYDDYNQFGQISLPAILNVAAQDGSNQIRIKATFQQILLDNRQQVNITIPSSYKIVVLE